MADKLVQHYINEERSRCVALVEALRYDPDFIVYCINSVVQPNEIDHFRKRYTELGNEPVDPPHADNDVEDLM